MVRVSFPRRWVPFGRERMLGEWEAFFKDGVQDSVCHMKCTASHLFGCRASVTFRHWAFAWCHLLWWLQDPSPPVSVTTSIISNLLTQNICGWHSEFCVRLIQHLFNPWHLPTRLYRNVTTTSLGNGGAALPCGAEADLEPLVRCASKVTGCVRMCVCFGGLHSGCVPTSGETQKQAHGNHSNNCNQRKTTQARVFAPSNCSGSIHKLCSRFASPVPSWSLSPLFQKVSSLETELSAWQLSITFHVHLPAPSLYRKGTRLFSRHIDN